MSQSGSNSSSKLTDLINARFALTPDLESIKETLSETKPVRRETPRSDQREPSESEGVSILLLCA